METKILGFILLILFANIVAASQPQWKVEHNYQWDNKSTDLYGSTYVSSPLIDKGIAELKIKITKEGDFAFKWTKEGGDKTFIRFYINGEYQEDALQNSYPVKNGDVLEWKFSANELGRWTATVFIPEESTSSPIINKPSIIEIYTGFPLSSDLFNYLGVRCSQGGTSIVDFSEVDTQKPGNYPYSIRCNENNPIQETGIITVLPLEFDAPSSSCVGQPGLDARISEIKGADYYWTLDGGTVASGQGTSRIQWTSGNSSCNLSVRINLAGVEKNLSRHVWVDSNCIYLDYCDNLNGNIRNDSELRLLCQPCGNKISFKGKVEVEGIHNLTISSSSPGQYAKLDGFIELGNSTNINIRGLNIKYNNFTIIADNLTNSNISDNKIDSGFSRCAVKMLDSKNNTCLNNDIQIQNKNNSISIQSGENNTIERCLDQDTIREKIFDNGILKYDITCWIHNIDNNCYTCNLSGTNTRLDLKDYTKQRWMDLHVWRSACIS
jgi:hypothetical protein